MSGRSVVVTVGGQRYTLRTEGDEAYVRALAQFVDDRIAEVQRGAGPVPAQKVAVLAAMNIADELFRQRGVAGAVAMVPGRETVPREEAIAAQQGLRFGEG